MESATLPQFGVSSKWLPFIDSQIAAGKFASREEVVDAGLSILEERAKQDERAKQLERLRAEVQLGIDQLDRGEGRLIDSEAAHDALFDEIWQKAEARWNANSAVANS